MTTIAAVRTPDGHVLACDTRAIDGTGRVWPVRSKLLVLGDETDRTVVGLTGPRMIRHAIEALGAPPFSSTSDADHVMRVWVEQLADSLRDRRVPVCDDGLVDAAQLVAHGDALWHCTDGLADRYEGGLAAIGSGGDLALGYLVAAAELGNLAAPGRPRWHLARAIANASFYDSATGDTSDVVELAGGRVLDPLAVTP